MIDVWKAIRGLRDAVVVAIVTTLLIAGPSSYFVIRASHNLKVASKGIGQANEAIRGQLASKDAVIASKDAQLVDLQHQVADKDTAIVGQTAIIGQIYSAAVALQQQVIDLKGQPKTIPITLPGQSTALTPPPSSPAPGSIPRLAPGASTAAPVPSPSPAINLQVQCPVICPPKR